jgi:hypothetical protein
VSDRDVNREIVRFARILQSSIHDILAVVDNLDPADLAAGLRETEPLRRISLQLDQDLAVYDRLQVPLDLPACRERGSRRVNRGRRRAGPGHGSGE